MFNQGMHSLGLVDELEVYDHMQETKAQIAEIRKILERSQEIVPNRRYHLSEAADFLRLSERTLKRRADESKLVIIKDGKKPFVTGAELLRYMRKEGTRRST